MVHVHNCFSLYLQYIVVLLFAICTYAYNSFDKNSTVFIKIKDKIKTPQLTHLIYHEHWCICGVLFQVHWSMLSSQLSVTMGCNNKRFITLRNHNCGLVAFVSQQVYLPYHASALYACILRLLSLLSLPYLPIYSFLCLPTCCAWLPGNLVFQYYLL